MKLYIEPLVFDGYYHIYNRGINGEAIFKEEKNYAYFLKKYAEYVYPIADTFSYCLLNNHFHLLVRTRSEKAILATLGDRKMEEETNEAFCLNALSRAFGSFFKSYAQSINKAYHRTGRLFEEPFRRKKIEDDTYLMRLIQYIHLNPQHHGFVEDFREYPHSSYHAHLLTAKTKLMRDEVINLFGSDKLYTDFHLEKIIVDDLESFVLE